MVTTLPDQHFYPVRALSDLYDGRWGIEELYKVTKSTSQEFHGKIERGVKQELYAAYFLITISQLFAKRVEGGANRTGDPGPRIQVNGQNARRLIGKSLETMFL